MKRKRNFTYQDSSRRKTVAHIPCRSALLVAGKRNMRMRNVFSFEGAILNNHNPRKIIAGYCQENANYKEREISVDLVLFSLGGFSITIKTDHSHQYHPPTTVFDRLEDPFDRSEKLKNQYSERMDYAPSTLSFGTTE